MRLSETQLREFRERGFFNLGPVFDRQELAEIGAAYDDVLRHPLLLGEKGKGKFQYGPLLQLQSPVLCRYATSPKLVAPMLELIGPDVRLYWDQAVSKPPGATSDVPWHQDNGYTPVEPEEYVTCTLALDPMTRENGCLRSSREAIGAASGRIAAPTSSSTSATTAVRRESRSSSVPVTCSCSLRSPCTAAGRTVRSGPAAPGSSSSATAARTTA